jgi:hypothetical protein
VVLAHSPVKPTNRLPGVATAVIVRLPGTLSEYSSWHLPDVPNGVTSQFSAAFVFDVTLPDPAPPALTRLKPGPLSVAVMVTGFGGMMPSHVRLSVHGALKPPIWTAPAALTKKSSLHVRLRSRSGMTASIGNEANCRGANPCRRLDRAGS